MEGFKEDIQITDATRCYQIVYMHKICGEIFWSKVLTLSIFVVSFFSLLNIYSIIKVVIK